MSSNYRRFLGTWLALLLGAVTLPAWAVSARLGDLNLHYDAVTWTRGDAAEESAEESLILRHQWQQQPVEVFVPRQRARVKGDPARFLAQLESRWRARYGASGHFAWVEAAGSRWRLLRRPSVEGTATVFQLVTVHAGEVYLLVAMLPVAGDAMPEPLRVLLEAATWGSGKDVATVPQAAPASAADGSAAGSEPPPATAAAPSPPVSASPPAAPAATVAPPAWRVHRRALLLPVDTDWDALSATERQRLGGEGYISGIGRSRIEDGLSWFLEGYVWRRDSKGEERRQAVHRQWHVTWRVPEGPWRRGAPLPLRVDYLGPLPQTPNDGQLRLAARLAAVCAQIDALDGLFDALDRGQPDATTQLGSFVGECPASAQALPPLRIVVSAAERAAAPEGHLSRVLEVPLPATWIRGVAPDAARAPVSLLVELRFSGSETGDAFGDAVLKGVVGYLLFIPDV